MSNPKPKGGIDQLIKDRFLLDRDFIKEKEINYDHFEDLRNEWNEDYTQDDIDADIAEHERELDQ